MADSQDPHSDSISSLMDSQQEVEACCEHQKRYKQLYQELSTLRIELRVCRQDKSLLKNAKNGFQEETKLLKEMLNQKKLIISKLNSDMKNANSEINHLQDENTVLKETVANLNSKLQCSQKQLNDSQRKLQKASQNHRLLQINITYMKQLHRKQLEHSQQKYTFELQQSETTSSKLLHNFTDRLTQLFCTTKDNIDSVKTNYLTINYHQQPVTAAQDWQSLLVALEKQSTQIRLELVAQEKVNRDLQLRNRTLEMQLNESAELFDEQKSENDRLQRLIVEENKAISDQQKMQKKKENQKAETYKTINRKLISLLKKMMINDQSGNLIDRLTQISPQTAKVELQVLLSEVQKINENRIDTNRTSQELQRQFYTLKSQFNELKEEKSLLEVKYEILQREHNEILEDNNRLIKFNTLSRFRIDRNSKTDYGKRTGVDSVGSKSIDKRYKEYNGKENRCEASNS